MPRQRRLNRVPVFAKGQPPPMTYFDRMVKNPRILDEIRFTAAQASLERFIEITEERPDISVNEIYDILKKDYEEAKTKYEAA